MNKNSLRKTCIGGLIGLIMKGMEPGNRGYKAAGGLVGLAKKGWEQDYKNQVGTSGDYRREDINPGESANRIVDEHGGIYEGELKDGMFHGFGVYRYPDGGFYRGDFKFGERDGRGVYTMSDGSRLWAIWHEGKPVGEVLLAHPNGKMEKFNAEENYFLPNDENDKSNVTKRRKQE